MDILLARQPIVNRVGSIDAFELLYRSIEQIMCLMVI